MTIEMTKDLWNELADFYRKVAEYECSKDRERGYYKLQSWAEKCENIADDPLKRVIYLPRLAFEYIVYKTMVKPIIEDIMKENL